MKNITFFFFFAFIFTTYNYAATLYNPPSNDDCETAMPLTVGFKFSDYVTIGTNVAATTSGVTGPGCANYLGQDVWFSIIVPDNGIITLEVKTQTGGIADTGGAVYSGSCTALNILGCSDDESPSGPHPIINLNDINLANQTIYFRVWEYGGDANGEFQVSAYGTIENDDCANPQEMILGTMITADTTGASDSNFGPVSCGATGGDQDIWYSFIAPSTGEVYIDTDADTVVIYDGCAGSIVACATNGSNISGLSANAYYYVRVFNTGIAKVAGPITLTISETTLSTLDIDNVSIVSYYPNPVKNKLTLNTEKEVSKIIVFNMLGQEVIRTAPNVATNELDMSNLKSGAYFVQVIVGQVKETIKVLKI